jgi:hypothetical protein
VHDDARRHGEERRDHKAANQTKSYLSSPLGFGTNMQMRASNDAAISAHEGTSPQAGIGRDTAGACAPQTMTTREAEGDLAERDGHQGDERRPIE